VGSRRRHSCPHLPPLPTCDASIRGGGASQPTRRTRYSRMARGEGICVPVGVGGAGQLAIGHGGRGIRARDLLSPSLGGPEVQQPLLVDLRGHARRIVSCCAAAYESTEGGLVVLHGHWSLTCGPAVGAMPGAGGRASPPFTGVAITIPDRHNTHTAQATRRALEGSGACMCVCTDADRGCPMSLPGGPADGMGWACGQRTRLGGQLQGPHE
jgi:hypothetical protein